jgi:hypothetical protein
VLGRGGQLEKALAQHRQILMIDPRVADARFGSAVALVGLQRYREGREGRDVLREAAPMYPDQPRLAEAHAKIEAALQSAR